MVAIIFSPTVHCPVDVVLNKKERSHFCLKWATNKKYVYFKRNSNDIGTYTINLLTFNY